MMLVNIFERDDDAGPWSETPGTLSDTKHSSCRQSYNILMTDGYWNGGSQALGNIDNSDGLIISGPNNPDFQYTPTNPYKDLTSDTLADVAMHFWNRDLRPNLANKVHTNTADSAFWQHMTTFTVGLGVQGILNANTDFAKINKWFDNMADSNK